MPLRQSVPRRFEEGCFRGPEANAVVNSWGVVQQTFRELSRRFLGSGNNQRLGWPEMGDYADLARLAHVSLSRVSQIMNLTLLAPDIQEAILFLPATDGGRAPALPVDGCHRPSHGGAVMLTARVVRCPLGERFWGTEDELC